MRRVVALTLLVLAALVVAIFARVGSIARDSREFDGARRSTERDSNDSPPGSWRAPTEPLRRHEAEPAPAADGDHDLGGLIWPSIHHSLAGSVVDVRGAPIPGARVTVMEGGVYWFGIPPDTKTVSMKSCETDEYGRFRLEGLGAYEWSLWITKKELLSESRAVTAGDQRVFVRLMPGASVSGRVVHPGGEPAIGADVEGVETDRDGAFRLSGLPAGTQVLHAKDGRHHGELSVTLTAGEHLADVCIDLDSEPERIEESKLSIRVLGPDGRALVGCRVGVKDEGLSCTADGDPETDAEGRCRFVVDRVAGTRVTIDCYGAPEFGSMRWRHSARTISQQASGEVELRLAPPRRLDFRVKGAPNAEVSLGSGYLVDQRGNEFSFAVSPESSTRYWVNAAGYVSVHGEWDGRSGEILDIRLAREGIVSGRILDAEGRPATRARVNFRSLDEDGRFRLGDLKPGRVPLEVRASCGAREFAVLRREVSIQAGQELELGDIVLPAAARLAGVIVDKSGRPAGGVQIMALARETGPAGYAITGANGRFAIPVLGGPMRVVAWKRGTGIAISAPTMSNDRLKLQLVPEPVVRLQLMRDGGQLPVRTADGFELQISWYAKDKDRLWALPACPLRIEVEFPDGSRFVRELDPAPGATLSVTAR